MAAHPARRVLSVVPVRALVDLVDRTKHHFTPAATAAKRAALADLAGRTIRDARVLLRLHEALAFLRAYPDGPEILEATQGLLGTVGDRIRALLASGRGRALEETGLAGTTVRCPLSYPAARWLARRFPDAAELDWDDADAVRGLDVLLPFLAGLAEEEVPVEASVPARAWLAAIKGTAGGSDLRWLLDRLDPGPGAAARRVLYDVRELGVRWDLGETPASRTRAGIRVPRVFFHRGPLLRWRGPLRRRLGGPRAPVRQPAPREAMALLDASRAAVLVRYREVHAFNFADPRDLVVAEAGRGVAIVWFGVRAPHRLPLRAHYGYLVLKNGVPVGYGDASLLFDWVEIAYNIFDTFRHGESAFIFARLLAFLHQTFGVREVHLNPYQVGHENPEAIDSGAFWFYYKLGFRPKRRELRRLAVTERRQVTDTPGYRSSPEALARLAEGGMFVALDARAGAASRDFDAGRLSRCAAAHAAHAGHRSRERGIAAYVARRLGSDGWRRWPRPERIAFERLAPVLAAIPDLERWSGAERRALVGLARAKGGPREADYLRRMRADCRLRASLLALGCARYSSSSSSRRSSSRPK